MVWKYAKIVYTQITRNTQEPRIMIKIFFHSEFSSLYCRMEICWLRWYTPGILRGLEWIRFLFRYRMSDLSPNRLGRLTHRYRWSFRTQRFVFSIRPLLSTKICDRSAISKRSLPGFKYLPILSVPPFSNSFSILSRNLLFIYTKSKHRKIRFWADYIPIFFQFLLDFS